MPDKKPKRPNIAIDFDGTIAKYPKFISPGDIPFGPIEDAKESIEVLAKHFRIVIFSVRAKTEDGRKGIADWMAKHKIPYNSITDKKPSCRLYIDDNAIRFEGNWKQTVKDVAEFVHYTKKK